MNTENIDFDRMLKARTLGARRSTCQRRQIGVYIPNDKEEDDFTAFIGTNNPPASLHCCSREDGICPAIHAEVQAVTNLLTAGREKNCSKLYIWAEVCCHQCLSFIFKNSHITTIYCLSPTSYANEYARINNRLVEIQMRKDFAKHLGIDVIELDREEIIQYGILRYTESNV